MAISLCITLFTPADYTLPVFEYGHTDGRVAIIGGYVYRSSNIPSLRGHYVFSDYLTGEILIIDAKAPYSFQVGADGLDQTRAIGRDKEGELYFMSGTDLYKIVASAP